MNSNAQPLIVLQNVSKVYSNNGTSAIGVSDVTVEVHRGEILLLMGPSGSGKTTLLTLIAGLVEPSSGCIELFGKKIHEYSSRELQQLRAKKLGFVFQNFLLIEALTVVDNVALVAQFDGKNRQEAYLCTHQLLGDLHIHHLAKKIPSQLSQGEKQRVAVARALINNPDVIIADEPTANLESGQGFEIIQLLHKYAKEHNKCVIIASHDLRIVEFADRVVRLEDGKMVSFERNLTEV